jgi:uncharacterized membrane protein YbjE (DUF340 family)
MDGMVTYIGLLLISLIAGIAAGLIKGKLSENAKKYLSATMTCLVFVLILSMGLKTGSNEDIIANLGVYGLQSLLITVGAILGSIVFALLFEKLLFKEGIK